MSDAWLPLTFLLPDGARISGVYAAGERWQIVSTIEGGRALVVLTPLFDRWTGSGLISPGQFRELQFGITPYWVLECGANHSLAPLSDCRSPRDKAEALAFATALRATRDIDQLTALTDGIYVEQLSRFFRHTPRQKIPMTLPCSGRGLPEGFGFARSP